MLSEQASDSGKRGQAGDTEEGTPVVLVSLWVIPEFLYLASHSLASWNVFTG